MNPIKLKTVPRVPVNKNPDPTNRVVYCPEGVAIVCEYCDTRRTVLRGELYYALWMIWSHQKAVHNRHDPEPVQLSKGKTPDDPEAVQPSRGKIPDDPEPAQPSNEKISDDPEAV